ncbi:hypothetical protein WJX79_010293 [Trebouxia sp. C0005]
MSLVITDDAANLKADMYNYMGDYPSRWPVRYSIAADLGMKARLIDGRPQRLVCRSLSQSTSSAVPIAAERASENVVTLF